MENFIEQASDFFGFKIEVQLKELYIIKTNAHEDPYFYANAKSEKAVYLPNLSHLEECNILSDKIVVLNGFEGSDIVWFINFENNTFLEEENVYSYEFEGNSIKIHYHYDIADKVVDIEKDFEELFPED